MKWIAQLTISTLIAVVQTNPGCQTTTKKHRKPVHVHHTKVVKVGDDAAIKAIIKSLQEDQE